MRPRGSGRCTATQAKPHVLRRACSAKLRRAPVQRGPAAHMRCRGTRERGDGRLPRRFLQAAGCAGWDARASPLCCGRGMPRRLLPSAQPPSRREVRHVTVFNSSISVSRLAWYGGHGCSLELIIPEGQCRDRSPTRIIQYQGFVSLLLTKPTESWLIT